MSPASPAGQPDVSVIVVSADSGPGLHDCVRRALACAAVREVLLIDNGSRDGVPEAVARAFQQDDRLTVIFNRANLGFGPAVNRAARRARGSRLLVLNPDCLLEPDTVAQLGAALDAHPRAGLVGAVVCDAQGEPDPASHRRDPLLARTLNTLFKRSGEGVNVDGPMPDATVAVEAVSGALMLVSRRVFDYLEGFDERYFLHCEDLDLCRRVRDAGYRVLLAGGVRVLHGKGGSSRHRPVFVSWHKHRGMWRWFRSFDPDARRWHLAAIVWLGIWAHFAMKIPGQLWRRVTVRATARSATA
ncbi:MAG TPA: glycosyltransferase family 2 protein [Dyella sp.]|nr:glycosyltransferase family 2 protein [Dyella sp.]